MRAARSKGEFMRRLGRLKIIAMSFALLATFISVPTANAAAQKISYFMNGDCSDYYDEKGEYAFFQSEPDWSCYISVKVSPTKPVRSLTLQYWSGTRWKIESKAVTNSKGIAYLYFDEYCDDEYCDGEWKYRVTVAATTGQKSVMSNSFYVTFYPDEDPNY